MSFTSPLIAPNSTALSAGLSSYLCCWSL